MTQPRPRTAAANDAAAVRTANASASNWERGTHTRAVRLLERVSSLTNRDLVTLTERLLVECVDRGIPVPEP